jgi:hypothetical protein
MDAIVLAVKSLWEQIPTVVTQLPSIELIYAILFLPVLVAAFARRVSTFCCAVLLASVAVIAILNPAHLPFVTALGAYLGSSAIAILGIVQRRWEAAIKEELLKLRNDVNALWRVEERRSRTADRSSEGGVVDGRPRSADSDRCDFASCQSG